MKSYFERFIYYVPFSALLPKLSRTTTQFLERQSVATHIALLDKKSSSKKKKIIYYRI
jgi:hypothetical protein